MKIDNKENNLPLYLFQWKDFVGSFMCLLGFISIKKRVKRKNIFGQHKKYSLFLRNCFPLNFCYYTKN